MFRKILIANRGEIAVRVIRACRDLGVSAAVVFSEVDRSSLAVRLADEAYPLGDPTPSKSYLNLEKVIRAAKEAGCEAIHPGYGFLSENPALAERCEAEGMVFIGPTAATLRLAGDKVAARKAMRGAKVPVIPGADSPLEDLEALRRIAGKVGFPMMLKATGGGGGKGIRTVAGPDELESAFNLASSEASKAFGDPRLYAERRILNARHVEVQILGDSTGKVVHLGERDCSLQRRHQKVLEESPCSTLSKERRRKLHAAAVRGAKAVGYTNAGTVEFLVEPDGAFYFLEVNARLQVEHPVTEAVTGVDLVREQIRIAAGLEIPFGQREIRARGASMEARIYAEDPDRGFAPAPGRIGTCVLPGGLGVRVDSGAMAGMDVPIQYDPLIAKVISWGSDREEAIRRLRGALGEMGISGVPTTAPLLQEVLGEGWFHEGRYDTGSLEAYTRKRRPRGNGAPTAALAAALVHHLGESRSPGHPQDGGRPQSLWTFWGRVRQHRRWQGFR